MTNVAVTVAVIAGGFLLIAVALHVPSGRWAGLSWRRAFALAAAVQGYGFGMGTLLDWARVPWWAAVLIALTAGVALGSLGTVLAARRRRRGPAR